MCAQFPTKGRALGSHHIFSTACKVDPKIKCGKRHVQTPLSPAASLAHWSWGEAGHRGVTAAPKLGLGRTFPATPVSGRGACASFYDLLQVKHHQSWGKFNYNSLSPTTYLRSFKGLSQAHLSSVVLEEVFIQLAKVADCPHRGRGGACMFAQDKHAGNSPGPM